MPPFPQKKNAKHGFSLPETVIALAILGMVLMAFTGAILISQKLASQNLLRTSAYLAAQSYLDQVRSMPAATLNRSINNPSTYPLPTQGISTEADDSPSAQDPLYLNTINKKTILVDIAAKRGGTSYKRMLELRITPKVKDKSPGLEAYEIKIDFSYEAKHMRTISYQSGSVRFLKTKAQQ